MQYEDYNYNSIINTDYLSNRIYNAFIEKSTHIPLFVYRLIINKIHTYVHNSSMILSI